MLALHRCNFNKLVQLIMEDAFQPNIAERKRTVAALRSTGRKDDTILTSTSPTRASPLMTSPSCASSACGYAFHSPGGSLHANAAT